MIPDFPDGCAHCFALGGGWIGTQGCIDGFEAPAHAPGCVAAGVPF